MRRKVLAKRILALILTAVLFFGDDQIVYTFASGTGGQFQHSISGGDTGIQPGANGDQSQGGGTVSDGDSGSGGGTVSGGDTGIQPGANGDQSQGGGTVSDGDLGSDGGTVSGGDAVCQHEWIRDPETLMVMCSICGEYDYDYVEEDECPEGGFHIYDLKEDGTGYVCVLCGAEKEILGPLDVTLEMYLYSTGRQISLMAAGDYDDPASSSIPHTKADLEASGKKQYDIASLGDLLTVQALSQETTLEGYEFRIMQRSVGTLGSSSSNQVWDLKNTDFNGLGTEEFPFSGTIGSYYSELTYNTDKPIFRYLSTTATVKNMTITGAISTTGDDPMGILAGCLVKGSASAPDCVTLENVKLDGNVTSTGGAAGLVFGRVEAKEGTSMKLPYHQNNIKLGQVLSSVSTVTGFHAGGFTGETIGDVEVDITDSGVIGKVAVRSGSSATWTPEDDKGFDWDTTPAGGMFVGAMKKGKLQISGNSVPYQVNVGGTGSYYGVNGGFVGMAIGTDVSTSASAGSLITVERASTLSGSAYGIQGRVAGGILGYYEHSADDAKQTLQLAYITVSSVYMNANPYYAGGIIGRYFRGSKGDVKDEYDTIDFIQVSGTTDAAGITTAGYAGGVVGFVNGSNLRIGGQGAGSIQVSASVYTTSLSSSTGVGGVVGLLMGRYVEISHAAVSSKLGNGSTSGCARMAGGIVGAIGKSDSEYGSVVKISDITVTAKLGANAYRDSQINRGGVLGKVWSGNLVALDGTIDTSGLGINGAGYQTSFIMGRAGYIAGYQTESLIYLEESAEYSKPDVTDITTEVAKFCVDDIGNYGGVYRNGSWGESGSLFSYESASVTGTVTKNGDQWTIDSAADLIRLAVVLNTEGKFAAACFNGASKSDLLKGDYLVTRSLTLKNSGVYCLNRNDYRGFSEEGQIFSGTFSGSSVDVIINLGDITTRQAYVALFPNAGNGAKFSNFTLKRTISGVGLYGAGIACHSTGDFTAEKLSIDLTSEEDPSLQGITGLYYPGSNDHDWGVERNGSNVQLYNANQYFAGLVAYVEVEGTSSFTVNSVKVNGTLFGDHSFTDSPTDYYGYVAIGGMIAEYAQTGQNSKISVDDFELMEKFKISTVTGYYVGGMIAKLNSSASVSSTSDSTILSVQEVVVHNGAAIEGTGGSNGHAFGGWLGHTWKNVIPDADAHYSVKDITIGDGGTAAAGPQYTSRYTFGGLVETVTGRIQLKDIKIQNGTYTNATTADGAGLLFRVGNNAVIEIDGYQIAGRDIEDMYQVDGTVAEPNNAGSVQVVNCGSLAHFDEIVTYSLGTAPGSHNDFKTGGIVNIIYDGFSDDSSAQHRVYQNRLLEPKNDRGSRYYYNLFGNSFEGEDQYLAGSLLSASDCKVTDAKQMMIWHLTQYMNDSIRRFLSVYYKDGKIADKEQDTQFTGTIDLSKVSYYPTSIESGTYSFDSAVITFYGQEITDEAGKMTPSSDQKQHFMMHGGLFLSKETPDGRELTIKGGETPEKFLTLKGSIANLSDDTEMKNYAGNPEYNLGSINSSGALFVRDIKGKKNIYHVRLDGLYVADYDAGDPTGLLIAIVKDETTLDLSWIETTDYSEFHSAHPGQKVASALIGLVGTPKASKISIEFKNMKLDSRKTDGIFQYASLIDENYYVEDTENPTRDIRRIRYLFTQEAFEGTDGTPYFPFGDWKEKVEENKSRYGENQYASVKSYVTIGYELGEGIEYWNVEAGPEKDKTYNLPFKDNFTWTEENVENNYLPYVHTLQHSGHAGSKDIEVNPKNKSIEQGCGTYEDPYIIESPKQLLALARYLQNKNDYKYLGGWKIHKFKVGREKNGDEFCDGESDHEKDDLIEYPWTCDEDGNVNIPKDFPTQEELCQAYYLITADIDMSSMANSTDRQIAEDFVGLGTSRIPFRGVIIGRKQTDNSRPTITLPRKTYWTNTVSDVNSGLIQYAIGAVVKDLVIEGATDDAEHEKTGVAKVNNMGSGVMAIILGGDNIIDNVKVKLDVVLDGKSCGAGAYAAVVEQGSLILRNLHEDAAKDFRVGTWDASKHELDPLAEESLQNYDYVSGLIGKVEDGFVIYEDDFNGGTSYNQEINGHKASVLAHDATEISGVYKSGDQKLPISKHYDIIVKSQLDKDAGNKKITITSSTADGKTRYTANITSSAQLQIVSMAINSDAFSVYCADGGYRLDAACRKADYKEVGQVTKGTGSGAGSDFYAAVHEDDEIYYYPYVYKNFFDFSGVTVTAPTGERLDNSGWQATLKQVTVEKQVPDDTDPSKTVAKEVTGWVSTLNVAIPGVTEIMTYQLKGGVTYDLAQYCRGFRGIGATYGMLDTVKPGDPGGRPYGTYDKLNGTYYSDFRANFDGQNATIQLGIDRMYDETIHTAALFNDLLDRDASSGDYFTIENIVVKGKVSSIVPTSETDGSGAVTDTTDGDGNYPNRTAAVVGLMRRPWKLSNITIQEMEVTGRGHTGGIVAWVEPGGKSGQDSTGADIVNFELTECKIGEGTEVVSYGGSAGGIIAVVTQNDNTGSADAAFDIRLTDCSINGKADKRVRIEVKNRTEDISESSSGDYGTRRGVGRSGGFIGYVGRKDNGVSAANLRVNVKIGNSGSTGAKVEYADITGAYSTGGLIGTYDMGYTASENSDTAGKTVDIAHVEVTHCKIQGYRGNTGSDDYYYTYGVGGLIGEMRAGSLTIQPGAGAGTGQELKLDNTSIVSSQRSTGSYYGMYTGGLVGCLKVYTGTFADITMGTEPAAGAGSGPDPAGTSSTVTVESALADVGGIIGCVSYGAGTLKMGGIVVSGMTLMVDNRTETEKSEDRFGAQSVSNDIGYAGGVIGTAKMTLELAGDGTGHSGAWIAGCRIASSKKSAGGIVGIVDRNNVSSSYYVRSTTIQDVVIENNTIGYNNSAYSDTRSGGIYGDLGSNYSSSSLSSTYMQTLQNAAIRNNWIYGYYTGGVLGYAVAGRILRSVESDKKVTVENNNLYGRYVGGVAGYFTNGKIHYIGAEIKNNRMQAYEPSSSNCAYAGGLIGYLGSNSSTISYDDYRLDLITVEKNQILTANAKGSSTSKNVRAGGLFGSVTPNKCYLYQPTLTDNQIGYSETEHVEKLMTPTETVTVGGASVKQGIKIQDTLSTLFNSTDGEIGKGSRDVKLLGLQIGSVLTPDEMPDVTALKRDGINGYSARIGNFAGGYNEFNGHVYILAPKLTYGSDITTRPVIDVGGTTGVTAGSTALLDEPYVYRNRIHIIYYEPETSAAADSDAAVWNTVTMKDAGGSTGTDNWKTLFSGIDYKKLMEAYRGTAAADNLSAYLDPYRLKVQADATSTSFVEDVYKNLYRTSGTAGETLVSKLKIKKGAGSDTTILPVIYLDTRYGSTDQLIKSVVAALTGVGGVYSSGDSAYSAGMAAVTKITATPMLISHTDGTISVNTASDAVSSLKAVKTGNVWSVDYTTYDDDGTSIDMTQDPPVSTEFAHDQTFTLLTVTYSWNYTPSGLKDPVTREVEIKIPVFVVERLMVDTHMRITEGLEYNAEKVKEEGLFEKVVVANDSSYTLYMEYIYSDTRRKYENVAIPKSVGTYVNNGTDLTGKPIEANKPFAKGTKLTLIDVDDDNRVYYYTATGEETEPIPYTAFQDENGTPYKAKLITGDDGKLKIVKADEKFVTRDYEGWNGDVPIGEPVEFEYSNVAVERYLILVDISGIKEENKLETGIRMVDSRLKLEENAPYLAPLTTLTEHTFLQTTIQAGISIQFINKGAESGEEKTWITGNVMPDPEEGHADIWAAFEIAADSAYWRAVGQNGQETVLDSKNHDKYLELQLYMTEHGSDDAISLPDGTYVTIDGFRTTQDDIKTAGLAGMEGDGVLDALASKGLDPYYRTANVYFYKDGTLKFPMNDLRVLIDQEMKLHGTSTDGKIRWAAHLRLDFANAEMTPFNQDLYDFHINLLRTEDAEYPAGGEVLDIYNQDLRAARKMDLACALETDDLMQLGINTYNGQTAMPHNIDFDFKMDFNGMMTGVENTDREMAKRHYTTVYRIWEKKQVGNTTQYVPYEGSQLQLTLIRDPDGKSLTRASKDNHQFWYVDYQFSWKEISDGTKVESSGAGGTKKFGEGVIVRDVQLTVNDAANMDLSNYKVQVMVFPNDFGYSANGSVVNLDSATSLSDFFVFTVAKLKTDLDY